MTTKGSGPGKSAKTVRRKHRSNGHRIAVMLIIVFIAAIRIRLLDFPLERDEGEYAYTAQLILQGVPPYKLAYNMKLPGTYAAYAVILALFGQTGGAVHWGLLLINASTIVLVYLLGARLFGPLAGVVAGASFGLLAVSPSVLGFAGHATHFVVLPAVGGILLLLKGIESGRIGNYYWSGLLVGLAFIMKQPGVVFVVFAGLYFVWSEWHRSAIDWPGFAMRGGAFSLGAILPFGLTCIVMSAAGVFDKFWFWTFSYAREYASSLGLARGFHVFLENSPGVIGPSILIWIAAGMGLTAFWWDRKTLYKAPFLIGFLVFSFLGVCPGFYFREHYFILMLPAVALLAGVGVGSARECLARSRNWISWSAVPSLLFLAAYGYTVLQQKVFLFELNPATACRMTYGANPFPESLEIAKYLRNYTQAGARIAVFGSEPQIYFYSGRRSATGYIYTYGLMEEQEYALRMQQEMVAEIEQARPAYIIYVDIATSWLARPGSEKFVFTWCKEYLQSQYELDGVIDIVAMDRTEYRWGGEAKEYEPRSQSRVYLFRRREF